MPGLLDFLLEPSRDPEKPNPSQFFSQLFSGGKLPDIGPVDDVVDGARQFLGNVPKENGLAAVLDVVQRPNFAIASGVQQALRGGNVGEVLGAMGSGFTGQRHTTFNEVLAEQGVPEGPRFQLGPIDVSARDVAGTVLDIGLDPTTYLTFGAGAAAKAGGVGATKLGATTLKLPGMARGTTILPFDALSAVAHAADVATNLIPKGAEAKSAIRDMVGQVFESNYHLKAAGFTDVAEGVQRLRRAPNVIKGETIEAITKQFEPLSEQQRALFFKAADTGFDLAGSTATTGDTAVDDLLKWYRGEYAPSIQAMKDGMGLTSHLDNYIRHVFPERLTQGPGVGGPVQKRAPGSFKERKGAAGYSEDPVLALVYDAAETKVRKETNDFVERTLTAYGQKLKPDEAVPAGMVEYFPKGRLAFHGEETVAGRVKSQIAKAGSATITDADLRDIVAVGQGVRYAVPEAIGRTLNEVHNPKEMLGFFKMLDTVQGVWKASVTTLFPAFHVRNETGNLFQNWLADVKDPRVYVQAAKLQGAKDLTSVAVSKTGQLVKPGDPDALMVGEGFLRELKMRGVLHAGYFGEDVPHLLAEYGKSDSGLARIAQHAGLSQQRAEAFKWLDYGFGMRKAGAGLEDNAKLAHVLGRMQQGDTLDEAVQSAKKYLFDYGDLSDTEKALFRRVMPFYSWSRKNVPLVLDTLARQPGKDATVAKVTSLFGDDRGLSPEQQALFPEYLAERFNVVVDNADPLNPKVVNGLGLPLEDLNKFFAGSGIDTLQRLMSDFSPMLKMPFEIAFNTSAFTGGKITDPSFQNYYRKVSPLVESIPGLKDWLELKVEKGTRQDGSDVTYYSADPFKNYLLMSVAGRVVGSASKAADERMDPWQKVLNLTTGVKATTVDMAKPVVRWDYVQKELQELRNAKLNDAATKVAQAQPGSPAFQVALLDYRKQRKEIMAEFGIRQQQAREEAMRQQGLTAETVEKKQAALNALLPPNELALEQYHAFDPEDFEDERAFFQARDAYVAGLPNETQAFLKQKSLAYIDKLAEPARSVEQGYQQALGSFRQYMSLQPYAVPVAPERLSRMQELDRLYRALPTEWDRARFKGMNPDLALYHRVRATPSLQRTQYVRQHPELRAFGLIGQIS